MIFLDIYYSVLQKKQEKTDQQLVARAKIIPAAKDIPAASSSVAGELLKLIPVPQKVRFTGGEYKFRKSLVYSVTDSLKKKTGDFLDMIPGMTSSFSSSGDNIQFILNKEVPVQGYIMDIKPGKIVIQYSNEQGLYYSIVSLKVLKQNYSGTIPCVYIEDSPDLEVRGLMLDISRNKVPTKETLLQIASLLADLKYNHLELYIEGFSFAYPTFKNLWEGKTTPVTGDEVRELDSFCRTHFIDLAANQNSLGHMMAWLATDQYKDLAECPGGFKMFGLINAKTTLDPSDPRSLDLISGMTDDLLPNFSSHNFNVNLDEPFELGKGKSKEICAKKGEGEVYLDYALKLHDIVLSKHKNMMMWADIVLRHPDLIPKIPKDITLLDWGYESSYPYERHCKLLQSSGLKYMVCPGTNSWTSITGRTDNMLATIEVATTNGVKYGASGMLITDWGDMGHWQYLPVSYAGYAAGAALSWNSKSARSLPLAAFLNSYVFKDRNSIMGDLVLDLGRYNRFEEFPLFNMTTTMLSMQFGLRDKILISAIFEKVIKGVSDLMSDLAPEMITLVNNNYNNRRSFDYNGLAKFLDEEEALLKKAGISTADSLIVRDEYSNAIRLIRLGSALQSYVDYKYTLTMGEEKSRLKNISDLGKLYLSENKRLWLARNKPGEYDASIAVLDTLIKQADDRLLLLEKSSVSRGINRLLERIGTAGAVLYIRSAS
jgi:hypothetical protein